MLKFFIIIAAVLLCSYQLQRILDRRMSSHTPEQKLQAFGYAFNGSFSNYCKKKIFLDFSLLILFLFPI